MSPTLAVLPGVTLVLVGEPILTPSSNPALRGVTLEVVGETTLERVTPHNPGLFFRFVFCTRVTPVRVVRDCELDVAYKHTWQPELLHRV